MALHRLLLAILLFSGGLALAAWPGSANSSGAPMGASENGCMPCHGPQPSSLATVALQGVPDSFVPGQSYNLTLAIGGNAPPGVSNQGGFAVSADEGTFNTTGDETQVREGMVTHTTAGNDQRSWTFTWLAPEDGNDTVTFSYAANAVDGNGIAEPGDQWVRATSMSERGEAPTRNTSPAATPTPSEQDTPSVGFVTLVVAVLCMVLIRRRR